MTIRATQDATSEEHRLPTMQITRGAATEEELAALIAVVSDAYAQEASEAVTHDHARRAAPDLLLGREPEAELHEAPVEERAAA